MLASTGSTAHLLTCWTAFRFDQVKAASRAAASALTRGVGPASCCMCPADCTSTGGEAPNWGGAAASVDNVCICCQLPVFAIMRNPLAALTRLPNLCQLGLAAPLQQPSFITAMQSRCLQNAGYHVIMHIVLRPARGPGSREGAMPLTRARHVASFTLALAVNCEGRRQLQAHSRTHASTV